MYIKSNISLIITLLLSMFIYTTNVTAMDCYEKSPNFISLKDKYYDVETVKVLSDIEKIKLENLFDNIKGKWEGESTYTDCTGPDRAPRKKIKKAAIDVKIKSNSNDSLLIVAKKSYPNNITKYDGLELLGDIRIFEFNFLNDNNLFFSERAFKKNDNGSSRHTETIYKITFKRKSLILVRNYYSNGVLVAEDKWSVN